MLLHKMPTTTLGIPPFLVVVNKNKEVVDTKTVVDRIAEKVCDSGSS